MVFIQHTEYVKNSELPKFRSMLPVYGGVLEEVDPVREDGSYVRVAFRAKDDQSAFMHAWHSRTVKPSRISNLLKRLF